MDLSVLFLTYNRSDLLSEAIHSLEPGLSASGLSFEIIVADDASSSEHKRVINSQPIDQIVSGDVNGVSILSWS
jgi:glycosyltransferase involved in cell wall biosynthesis